MNFLWALAVAIFAAFTNAAAMFEPSIERIVIAGDSTAADYPPERAPQIGWGQALPFFIVDDVEIVNLAVNGRSTKSYIDEGRWAALLDRVKPGDLVLISFGHNDSRDDAPERHAPALGAYKDNLIRFAADLYAKGAKPVILSSAARRLWEGPAMVETHGLYRHGAEQAAAQADAAFIDLAASSLAYFESIGREETKRDYIWVRRNHWKTGETEILEDNTHFSYLGACGVAWVVASQIRDTAFARTIKVMNEGDVALQSGERPSAVRDCVSWIEGELSPTSEWLPNFDG